MNLIRRALGFRYVRVIDDVELGGHTFAGPMFTIKKDHYEWTRVRPWWAPWRRG